MNECSTGAHDASREAQRKAEEGKARAGQTYQEGKEKAREMVRLVGHICV